MATLETAAEAAMRRTPTDNLYGRNEIPPITEPMGRAWRQPARELIEVDGTHALMSEATFEALAEYSCTMPTGVYPGKMWRRHDGSHDPKCKPEDCVWLLMWFGHCKNPLQCTINHRRILVVT